MGWNSILKGSKMAKGKPKKVYSYRQYPSKYEKTLENARKSNTTLAQIIDDAFDKFNEMFDAVNHDGK